MAKELVTSNFAVSFSASDSFEGSIKLEAYPDNPSPLIPGDNPKFYMFYKNVEDIKVLSSLGNITYLSTEIIEVEEIITVTKDGPISTKYPIKELLSASILGNTLNYGGIKSIGTEHSAVKADESIDYILAVIVLKYASSADLYELSGALLQLPEYEVGVIAVGKQTQIV